MASGLHDRRDVRHHRRVVTILSAAQRTADFRLGHPRQSFSRDRDRARPESRAHGFQEVYRAANSRDVARRASEVAFESTQLLLRGSQAGECASGLAGGITSTGDPIRCDDDAKARLPSSQSGAPGFGDGSGALALFVSARMVARGAAAFVV